MLGITGCTSMVLRGEFVACIRVTWILKLIQTPCPSTWFQPCVTTCTNWVPQAECQEYADSLSAYLAAKESSWAQVWKLTLPQHGHITIENTTNAQTTIHSLYRREFQCTCRTCPCTDRTFAKSRKLKSQLPRVIRVSHAQHKCHNDGLTDDSKWWLKYA